jgi:cell division protease FtsH
LALVECKGVPFYRVTVADIFTKFNNSAEKIKESFATWRKNVPCIVFIDEVESIVAHPAEGDAPNHALLQFLHEVAIGTDLDKQILMICTTNNFDLLDSSFVKLFYKLDVSLPDSEALNKLVEKYFPDAQLSKDLSRSILVSLLINRTPLDIVNCSTDCRMRRWKTYNRKVTLKMVKDWLKRNPLGKNETSRT